MGEDFQDEAGAVDYYAVLQESLNVTLLHAGEFVIEDAVAYTVGFAVFAYFLDLATSYICGAVGAVYLLDEGFIALYAGSFRQEAEFVEVFTGTVFVVILFNDSDEDRFFGEYFRLFQGNYLSWKITGKV